MAKRRKSERIDKNFHALIGQVVVEFGQLEDHLRDAVAGMVCPAIGWPLHTALFARTRFAELVDMYEFVLLCAFNRCQEDQKLTPEEKDAIAKELKTLRRDLAGLNERRNTIVHSAYSEVACNMPDLPEMILQAYKPVLHRRTLEDPSFDSCRISDEVTAELSQLISDIQTVSSSLDSFDHRADKYVDYLWKWYCTWYTSPSSPTLRWNTGPGDSEKSI